jgi:polyisoprenoid-binding protein YceI
MRSWSKYATIEYKSSRVNTSETGENVHRIGGDLTLHSITRRMNLDSQALASKDTLRAQGSFAVKQSDYGLRIASVAGGNLKVKDEVKRTYFIVGIPA